VARPARDATAFIILFLAYFPRTGIRVFPLVLYPSIPNTVAALSLGAAADQLAARLVRMRAFLAWLGSNRRLALAGRFAPAMP